MASPARYYQSEIRRFLKNLIPSGKKDDYIIFDHSLLYMEDIQKKMEQTFRKTKTGQRVVVLSFNYFWKPILNIASLLGLRRRDAKEPSWLDTGDISNFFALAGFEEIKRGNRIIVPVDLGILSSFINKYIAQLPIFNSLCLTSYQIFRKPPLPKKYSVSVVIPARNEEGNIMGLLSKIPMMGKGAEVIFVEGHSKDQTYKTIEKEIKRYKGNMKVRFYKQRGVGKADAVRLGFSKARNDLLMILDADISVNPKDLKKFYMAIANGTTEFANGSRLVYPMEGRAMRALNYIGNKMFSLIFSFLLSQRIKDTLCGTKAILRKDYQEIVRNRKYFGNFDPFGDYDLLFGASKLNLKIVDIPVRYFERKYGRTNISRFRHGLLLLKMTVIAASKIKFI